MTDAGPAAGGCGLRNGGEIAPDSTYDPDRRTVFSSELHRLPGLIQASTTRVFQAQVPEKASRVQEVQCACDMLGIGDYPLFLGEQKHTSNVALLLPEQVQAASFRGNGKSRCYRTLPQTDALVTGCKGVALAIQTADCAPVFLYDPVARIIGLAHAGWKGTLHRIAEQTVTQMTVAGSDAKDIVAWIGPMACACCYEVSPELINDFTAEFSEMDDAEIHTGRNLNLVSVNAYQLRAAGLSPANVHLSGICTIHQCDEFYSYRADNGNAGRILSIIAMQSD